MAFQFGTNWSELSRASGPIQGPLLSYETFTAFALEASFFGVLLFGRSARAAVVLSVLDRDGRARHHTFGLLDHGQQQLDAGAGRLRASRTASSCRPTGATIIFSPVVWVRFPHMLLAAYLTGAFCVAATGAWYLLRGDYQAEARIMLRMGAVPRGHPGAGAALLRPSGRRLRPRLSAGQVRRDRGRAGTTSSRRARCCSPGQTRRRRRNRYEISDPVSRQPDRHDEPHLEGSRADRLSAARTGRRCSSRSLPSGSWSAAGC